MGVVNVSRKTEEYTLGRASNFVNIFRQFMNFAVSQHCQGVPKRRQPEAPRRPSKKGLHFHMFCGRRAKVWMSLENRWPVTLTIAAQHCRLTKKYSPKIQHNIALFTVSQVTNLLTHHLVNSTS